MKFKSAEWDTDVTGDQLLTKLFQKKNNNSKKQRNSAPRLNNVENTPENLIVIKKGKVKKKINKKQKNSENNFHKSVDNPFKNNIQNKNNVIKRKPEIINPPRPTYASTEVSTENQTKRKIKKKLKRLQKINDKHVIKKKEKTNNKLTENGNNQQVRNNTPDQSVIKNKKTKSKNNSEENETKSNKQKRQVQPETIFLPKKKLKRPKQSDPIKAELVCESQNKSLMGLNVDFLKKQLKTSNDTVTLRDRMLARLSAARFRFLNEQLYTAPGGHALRMFQQEPQAFHAYHSGYRQQVAKWPINPLDVIIKQVRKLPEEKIIADFGCGDGRLAKSVPHKVHSFDLVSNDPNIIACDMSHVPLPSNSVHVAVFCLSLMGADLRPFLLEAARVLVPKGLLKVAEVESRFQEQGHQHFISSLEKFGFRNVRCDLSHNLFYFMDFMKDKEVKNKSKLPEVTLKACLYKKR